MLLDRMDNVTLTSNGVGTLDGNGERWWGIPGIGFLVQSLGDMVLLSTYQRISKSMTPFQMVLVQRDVRKCVNALQSSSQQMTIAEVNHQRQ